MEGSARQFICARCRATVQVCPACDRGQVYCDSVCAQGARRRSVREAGARYQRSRAGRLAHARRARAYRARCKIVTHQGSPEEPGDVQLLPRLLSAKPRARRPEQRPKPRCAGVLGRCCVCGSATAEWVRLDFLRYGRACPAPERPKSSSITTTSCQPSARARSAKPYWRRCDSRCSRT